MNSIKIQQDILKAVIEKPEDIRHQTLESDPDCTLIFHRGIVAYIMPTKYVKVKLPKENTTNVSLKLQDIVNPKNELEPTHIYYKEGKARRYAYKHDPEQWTCVDERLLKHFKRPTLYQTLHRKYTVIAVVEGETLVGAVMPCKEKD